MAKKLQSIRGMHDVLPAQSVAWQNLEKKIRRLLDSYGYQEIRTPIVELSELFCRAVGEVTDIVEKEMYTFRDKNGDSLTLRPEGTASCVRAGIQHGLLHNQQQRLWYMGSMFRHERPQKGRYRQFQQIGVETFGIKTPDVDAELIAMGARFWKILGLKNIRLELNSLGTAKARLIYREKLIEYFSQYETQLDKEAKRRLHTNPLRILDSKNPTLKTIIQQAPNLHDYLDQESIEHFDQLKTILDNLQIKYTINPRLVRGLDYYSRTVFEWITDELGAQGTVCAGGRYDSLVKQLGGRETPACGFAMGVERLLALMDAQNLQHNNKIPDVYLMMLGEGTQSVGMQLAEDLREKLPNISIITNMGAGSFKAQIKRADKSGARFAFILGSNELETQQMAVKSLRNREAQFTLPLSELEQFLQEL